MAETATIEKSPEQWEQLRAINSVQMLQEYLKTDDVDLRRKIYEQVCDQEFSHIPEVLDGETRTHFEFEVNEGRLFVIQPEGIVDWLDIHEKGVTRAKKLAQNAPGLQFYADIAKAERDEALEQVAQVVKDEASTQLVVSLDGSDLGSKEDLVRLGRDPQKRRAYLRTSVFDGSRLHLYSVTLDGLSVENGKQILETFGITLPSGATSLDILTTRVKIPGAQHDLLERLVPSQGRNNYEYVLSQKDLLKKHMDNLVVLASRNLPESQLACEVDELRYDIMSSFKQRLEGTWQDLGSLNQSVSNAGMIEKSNGTRFAGCDAVIMTQHNNMQITGYLNVNGLESANLFKKEFESKWCPNCLPKPRPGKKVKAWRHGDRIGCGSCGHEVDVCTKKVVHQGKKNKQPVKFKLW